MYEELVSLLRKKYDKAPMVMQAADAIEELQKMVEQYKVYLQDAINDLHSAHEKEPKWVPVTERLPEDSENVLAAFDDVVLIAFFDDHDDWVETETCNLFCPTHWMPLPKPPKEG